MIFLVAVGGCAVDPSLTSGSGVDGGAEADAPSGIDDGIADSPVADVAKDVAKDQSTPPTDSGADVACTTTCPSGTTCQGSTCVVPQGAPCNSAVTLSSSSGALSGTTCANTGTVVTTTCSSPVTGGATFIRYPPSGGPFAATVKAVNGPIQVEVLNTCGGTPTCYAIASGSSLVISVPDVGATMAIVSASSCSDFTISYQPS